MIAVLKDNKPLTTPGKKSFTVPTQALADAISAEWQNKKSFNAATMPFTMLAFTAIDRIADQRDNIIEVLLAYVDTDTICYRASNPELLERQKKQWDPVLVWAGSKFNALWKTVSGVMPLEQPLALHEALREYMNGLDDMALAAASVLASLYSSLVLAIAVVEKRLSATEALTLSRLEESFQAEQWGEDEEATKRQENILKEIKDIANFLRLLETA
jgi:chaperone required for assembly of F1-ATPase